MPPSYESQSFWEERFKKEDHFEWLGDGQGTIIPVLRLYLQPYAENNAQAPPLLLHIGAGTSTISDDLLEVYRNVYKKPMTSLVVLNTDFSEEVVRRGRQRTQESTEVTWEQLDLMLWNEMLALRDKVQRTEGKGFTFVVDKSTTDAISCSEDIRFEGGTLGNSPRHIHPLILSTLSTSPKQDICLHPAEILALHLASLTEPGAVWISLSYSSNRFPFIPNNQGKENRVKQGVNVEKLWELEYVEAMKVGEERGETGATVHAPDVFHYLYILRRTNTVVVIS